MTTSMTPSNREVLFLDQLLAEHGGMDRWQRCEQVEASLSSAGLAFTSRMQPNALRNRTIEVHPHRRHVVVSPYPSAGFIGHWTPDLVFVGQASGAIVAERTQPRLAFASLAKQFRWDALDILYFAGYALWNYLSFPFLLAERGVHVEESSVGRAGTGRRILRATFPGEFPTHCREQRFEIDAGTCQLRRHDYVADVIGRWASAANYCLASEQVEGFRFYTKRRVYPRLAGIVIAFPTLVWIDLKDIRVRMREGHLNCPDFLEGCFV